MQMATKPSFVEDQRRNKGKLRFLDYCHDTFGLGHLRRALALAKYFTETLPDAEVLIVTGSPVAHAFELPPRTDYVKLPAVTKMSNGSYRARNLDLEFAAIRDLRATLLRKIAQSYRPDVFLVDHAPQGLKGEALHTLEMLRKTQPDCLRVLGLRDITDASDIVRQAWRNEGVYQTLEQDYDLILVYGSQELYDIHREYELPPAVVPRVRYCGYIDRVPEPASSDEPVPAYRSGDEKLVVVTAGGGGDGFPLMRDYLLGLRQLASIPFTSVILTGPLLDEAQAAELHDLQASLPARQVQMESFLSDPMPLLRSADLVVSMAGYNTTTELLGLRQRMLLVPRSMPRQEQLIRASLLAKHGLAHVLPIETLTPEQLMDGVHQALAQPRPQPHQLAAAGISFQGQELARQAILEARERMASPMATVTPLAQEKIHFLLRFSNRHGLGHLMRGLNICRELAAMETGPILFYGSAMPPAQLWDSRFAFRIEGEPDGYFDWPQAMRTAKPAVAVYDTTLPRQDEWPREPDGPLRAYIMRRWKEERQDEVFAHGLLPRMDAVIVPHTEEEFGIELPSWLRERTTFVGPIVRLPDPAIQERLRSKYGLQPTDFVLTSTCGGGGFVEQAQEFFATVWAAHARLAPEMPNLRHIVVKGPNAVTTPEPLPGMIVVGTEPEMVNLLAISDLAIAEGGYNTVNEIRATRTPALFLPSHRNRDDQEERVRQLEARGLAHVCGPKEHHLAEGKLLDLCGSLDTVSGMRRRYESERLLTGNRRAAEILVGLASWK